MPTSSRAADTSMRVLAVVCGAGSLAPADETVFEFVATHLAPHKRPRHVCYVESLPRTAAGKLDRSALAHLTGALRPLRAPTILG